MSEVPRCSEPGCGLEMLAYSYNPKTSVQVCPRNADTHALCARVAELEARASDLEAAILDIDAHATPCGLLDPDDPEGSPLYYTISTGSLHRALGIRAGGAYKERPTFTREMVQEALRRGAVGANELKKKLDAANRIPGRLY